MGTIIVVPLVLKICPPVQNPEINALFASAWPQHKPTDFEPLLVSALFYVCAFEHDRLVGFAKVIGDGGVHGFLLDPTVAADRQRRGIGKSLVELCSDEARRRDIEWLHVDFAPELANFYSACGFATTSAGLRNLR